MTGKELILTGDVLAEGFDDCIIGIATVIHDKKPIRRVVYSCDKMVAQLSREFGAEPTITKEEAEQAAVEYLEFNTFQTYIGPTTPVYLWEAGQ